MGWIRGESERDPGMGNITLRGKVERKDREEDR